MDDVKPVGMSVVGDGSCVDERERAPESSSPKNWLTSTALGIKNNIKNNDKNN
jgi:hypothetical protein